MDVLNFISWIKRKDYRDVMPPDALTVVGVPDPKRDDGYLSIVVPISAFNIPAPYTLPIASANVLGGIKVGSGLSIDGSGVLSSTYTYTLPTATSSILGGIKVGSGLTIDGSGVLSTTGSYTLPIASASVLGGIKVGSGLSIDGNGVLSSSGLSGSGLQDYVARWTPNNTTLGYGVIRDNGTTLGIGIAPNSSRLLTLSSSTYDAVVESINNKNGAFGAIAGSSRGVGPLKNYGAFFTAVNSTTENTGTFSSAISSTAGINVGLQAVANNSSTDQNYAVQLQDHTVGIGRVLTCVTSDGHANWVPTISNGYVTIMQSGNTLSAVLTGIPNIAAYDWSFADSDPGFVFTSFTMLQNVTLSRITDTAQYIPLLIETVGPGVFAAYRYTALVKLRVIDENGYVYSDTYNYSENRFIIE